MTLKEIFAKMLLRLKGLSVDMAQALVDEFQTPQQLRSALLNAESPKHQTQLILDLTYGLQGKRKIPKTIAEALVKFWTEMDIS